MEADYTYPLRMEIFLQKKIQNLAKEERRSINQTILLLIEKGLELEKTKPKENK